ncbi:MAG: hypothetical protein ACRYHQ_09755 [Janthinobacterium lividum]
MKTPKPNVELRRYQIEHDLDYLHRERWNRITAELSDRIEAATPDERLALSEQLDRHYADRFRPETSRAALLAEVGASEAD